MVFAVEVEEVSSRSISRKGRNSSIDRYVLVLTVVVVR
jgi:hypothetical protein